MIESEKIISNKDFFKIAETDRLLLGGCWESIFLIDKINYKETHLGKLDGVVDIGLISKDNSWVITGREIILLWRNGNLNSIEKDELKCVDDIKQIGNDLVQLSVDSLNLNNNKSTWTLNTMTLELNKLD